MHEWSREGLDQVNVPDERNELPEQVESTSDDPGGMPYDDDLGEDAEGLSSVADPPTTRRSL